MRQFAKDLYHNEQVFSVKDAKFEPRNYCEIVHIGVVCSGFNSNVYFHALLKSLFLTRVNPIHFHLIVSNESEKVLRMLFRTWQLPQVKLSLYNMKNLLKDVRWVPNAHYSGNYGLLKLIFSKVVPSSVTKKLLILDTDLIVNGDIYMLWKIFEEFNYKQAIGIVENQSMYYLGKLNKANPWPALGSGFNSGVMLYDLEKMKEMKWDTLWVNLTKRLSLVYGQAELGDQDIINSLIVEHSYILYKLPCYWNTQMSDNSLSSSCYTEHKPMIVHWNSPKKFDVTTRDGEKFKGLANTVFELNGNWFRTLPQMCEDDTKITLPIYFNDGCQKFRKSPDAFYRTLLFFREYKHIADDCDITYVTHLSFDRIDLLEDIVTIWTGPISFTLYVTDAELLQAIQIIKESELLRDRTDISYHAVFKEGEFYPINTLRNTGLKHVNTPYVFLTDIDFIPMKSLFEILKDNIKSMRDLDKKALIVPAFEVIKSKNVLLPLSKIQLIEALDRNEVRPFLAEVWAAGHITTDYEKWRRELEPYQVKWKPNYEPYILVKSNVAPYDERFLGFGWNKVSHIMELEAQDYEFIVLSDVFIIHQPHRTSCDNMRYKKSATYRHCLQSLKKKFVQGLYRKYNKTFTDMNYSEDIHAFRRRRKRNVDLESTTTLYDSTDYFMAWGGKEKAEGRKEPRKRFSKKESDHSSRENLKEFDYYYYESEYPYNLTVFKLKSNETGFKERGINIKHVNLTSSEEHDYEYSDDDVKFKMLHESTTIMDFVDNLTILTDSDLVENQP